jgi:membrane fusion protein, macrolide-specific efflux system
LEVATLRREWPELPPLPGQAKGVDASSSVRDARAKRTRRVWPIVGGLLLTALVVLVAVNSRATDPGELYQTALIGRHDVEETVTATGRVRPRAHVDVGARVSGQLRKIHVAVGSLVREGDLLAEIDAEAQEAKVEGIRAELARLTAELAEIEAALVFAQRQHGRQAELSRSNAASVAKEDEARRDMNVAKARKDATIARIRQTEATLRAEKVALGYTRIHAPMAGTVVSVAAVEGQTLNANYEAPEILRIADLATMTVWTEVSESDVTKLSIGMPLRFTTLGHSGRVWDATLRDVLPVPHRPSRKSGTGEGAAPKSNIVSYTALFDVENSDRELRAEMTAQVALVSAHARNVVAIPAAALQMTNGVQTRLVRSEVPRRQIRILNPDGTTSVREIVTGVRGRRFVEVRRGVSEGERVIIGEVRRRALSSFRIER